MAEQTKTKALAKVGNGSIRSLDELAAKYKDQEVNLILPRIEMGALPAGTLLAVRIVQIDANDPGMVYSTDGGKKALTKHSLDQIGNAAGISWHTENRTDDRRHPHYCEFKVAGRVIDFDGTVRDAIGTKTYDLRADAGDGIPGRQRKAIKSEKQLNMALQFMTELCASKAKNRAIAAILGIKRSYTPAELERPFIIPKLVPDTSNESVQTAVIAGMVGGIDALFSRPQPQITDGRIIEAQVEEVRLPDEEEDPDLRAALDEARVNQKTGELELPPITEEQPKDVKVGFSQLYKHATDNKVQPKEWNSMVYQATKKKDYAAMTAEDLSAVTELVEARIANQ